MIQKRQKRISLCIGLRDILVNYFNKKLITKCYNTIQLHTISSNILSISVFSSGFGISLVNWKLLLVLKTIIITLFFFNIFHLYINIEFNFARVELLLRNPYFQNTSIWITNPLQLILMAFIFLTSLKYESLNPFHLFLHFSAQK